MRGFHPRNAPATPPLKNYLTMTFKFGTLIADKKKEAKTMADKDKDSKPKSYQEHLAKMRAANLAAFERKKKPASTPAKKEVNPK